MPHAHPITFTMPDVPLSTRDKLNALNDRIDRTRQQIVQLRHQLADTRLQLSVQRHRRHLLLNQTDHRFLRSMQHPSYQTALEDALSKPGPLVEKLATGLRLAQEGEDHPGLDPDPNFADPDFAEADFAEQIVAQATDEVNLALAAYARHEQEREAMEALHSDATCDSSGEA